MHVISLQKVIQASATKSNKPGVDIRLYTEKKTKKT